MQLPRRALIVMVLIASAVTLATLGSPGALRGMAPAQEPECPPDELLVKFQPTTDPAEVSARHGAIILSRIEGIDVYLLAVPPATGTVRLAALQGDPEVIFAEPNGMLGIPEQPPPAPTPCTGDWAPG